MPSTRLNHVSVHADDLETSVQFYEEVFGLERVPTYDFPVPIQFLRCGDRQLHVFERDTPAPEYHHFALGVEDFEAVYEAVAARDAFDERRSDADGHAFELPDGTVQLYVRDPAGNLVEVNWPDASTLDPDVVTGLVRREDQVEQSATARRATLYPERTDG